VQLTGRERRLAEGERPRGTEGPLAKAEVSGEADSSRKSSSAQFWSRLWQWDISASQELKVYLPKEL
jgi:hypothetical protein